MHEFSDEFRFVQFEKKNVFAGFELSIQSQNYDIYKNFQLTNLKFRFCSLLGMTENKYELPFPSFSTFN